MLARLCDQRADARRISTIGDEHEELEQGRSMGCVRLRDGCGRCAGADRDRADGGFQRRGGCRRAGDDGRRQAVPRQHQRARRREWTEDRTGVAGRQVRSQAGGRERAHADRGKERHRPVPHARHAAQRGHRAASEQAWRGADRPVHRRDGDAQAAAEERVQRARHLPARSRKGDHASGVARHQPHRRDRRRRQLRSRRSCRSQARFRAFEDDARGARKSRSRQARLRPRGHQDRSGKRAGRADPGLGQHRGRWLQRLPQGGLGRAARDTVQQRLVRLREELG